MTFFNYAWSALLQVSGKGREEVKLLLRDDMDFPTLGYDNRGYVVCLPKPSKRGEDEICFQGMVLNRQEAYHRKVIWRLFKAAVFHLSAHVAVSDFKLYDEWAKGKDINLASFAASLVEDALVSAYLKAEWPNLRHDIAHANALSYNGMQPLRASRGRAFPTMAETQLLFHVGMTKSGISEKNLENVRTICSLAKEIEGQALRALSKQNESEDEPLSIPALVPQEDRQSIATRILKILAGCGESTAVPSLLYTECYGDNMTYGNSPPDESEVQDVLQHLSDTPTKESLSTVDTERGERALESEICQVFSAWEARERKERKILLNYQPLLEETNFHSTEFPHEDYVAYLRNRTLLSSPIRRVMQKLRLLRNVTGEDFKHETGLVDLQEAIQVVASKSRRTDIFVREELQSSEQAWAILIDASYSLNLAMGTVQGVALSLGEVAKRLILDQRAWGMFGFNNRFYIVKDFTENFTAISQARIGGLDHSGLTYLPDGILVAGSMLRRRAEQAKVLIVVSDFFPSGYQGIERRLAEVVRQVERTGVAVIGIGVRSRAVRDYFRFNCTVYTPYDLMKKFTRIFMQYHSTL
jgi:nitric oxide reductase activation protein